MILRCRTHSVPRYYFNLVCSSINKNDPLVAVQTFCPDQYKSISIIVAVNVPFHTSYFHKFWPCFPFFLSLMDWHVFCIIGFISRNNATSIRTAHELCPRHRLLAFRQHCQILYVFTVLDSKWYCMIYSILRAQELWRNPSSPSTCLPTLHTNVVPT